ncbi:uncharacterized protein LOC136096786 [Hydra vulgaris]|uniref:uncharacterized protein LOC136096786 n=1 Tax=Hydra vulgaris TaxID=6087 RepID=UPI0032EA03EF
MYILIEFADSSIAVALHSWLESDKADQNGFHMVAFPDFKYTKTRYMLKDKLPALTTWETVPCKVLYKHESLKNIYKHCKKYSETGKLLSTDYENGRTHRRPLYLSDEEYETNDKKKSKLTHKENEVDLASPPTPPTTLNTQLLHLFPTAPSPLYSASSQPSSLFLSQSSPRPTLPLIETSSEYFGLSASVHTCFKARQKTPSSNDNEIEKSDFPISNTAMRSWFQEIFTSLIRIEDTQKTLMGMVVGLSNTKSAVNAPVEALKFSTTADKLDSHLTYWLDLNDCERQSLVTLI